MLRSFSQTRVSELSGSLVFFVITFPLWLISLDHIRSAPFTRGNTLQEHKPPEYLEVLGIWKGIVFE
jgi:hypothetical protein